MKRRLFFIAFLGLIACDFQKPLMTYSDYPTYSKNDLGLTSTDEGWHLKVWAPTAEKMLLHLYSKGNGDNRSKTLEFQKEDEVWTISLDLDKSGLFYTLQAVIDGNYMMEVVDPYVKLVGVNGNRGYIALPEDADPIGWHSDTAPALATNDIILYENL